MPRRRSEAIGEPGADQRYYASTYGRFNTADPYQASGGPASPASWNRYSYTRGDPVNRRDPRGLRDCLDCVGDDDGGGGDWGGGDDPLGGSYWSGYYGCSGTDPFLSSTRLCDQGGPQVGQLPGGGGAGGNALSNNQQFQTALGLALSALANVPKCDKLIGQYAGNSQGDVITASQVLQLLVAGNYMYGSIAFGSLVSPTGAVDVDYTYDNAGRTATTTYPMAEPFSPFSPNMYYYGSAPTAITLSYGYDSMGRPNSLTDASGATGAAWGLSGPINWVQNAQYDYAGRMNSMQYGKRPTNPTGAAEI